MLTIQQETAALMDLGGGSTQISFAVQDENYPEVQIGADSHNMFMYSHLGYGLMAGRAAVITLNVPAGHPSRKGEEELIHECFAPGVTVTYKYGNETLVTKGHDDHSYERCHLLTSSMIKHPSGSFAQNKNQPRPAKNQPLYALSYYYDRAIEIGMIPKDAVRGVVSLNHFRDYATKICGLNPIDIKKQYPLVNDGLAPFLCLDLCYIVSLLEDGFKITHDTPLNLAVKMNYNGAIVETAWPLGASLAEVSEIMI